MLNAQRKCLDWSLASWYTFKVSSAGAELGADISLAGEDHACIDTQITPCFTSRVTGEDDI